MKNIERRRPKEWRRGMKVLFCGDDFIISDIVDQYGNGVGYRLDEPSQTQMFTPGMIHDVILRDQDRNIYEGKTWRLKGQDNGLIFTTIAFYNNMFGQIMVVSRQDNNHGLKIKDVNTFLQQVKPCENQPYESTNRGYKI